MTDDHPADPQRAATESTIPRALGDPILNHGSGFTHAERAELGLTGRLPTGVLDIQEQADRVYRNLGEVDSDLQRNLVLEQVHNRNETLYYKVIGDHLSELLPIIYDPTVGEAIKRYSDEYRGQRGVFLSIDRPDEIEASFATLGLGPDDVDLVVCTDAEQILGIGDWGVGGIQISVGKLAIYTAGAGIDPRRTIAVSLDVGTDNPLLLNDPFYLGNRHARCRGEEYHDFIERYISTTARLFPGALLHFEDFGPGNARAILDEYAERYRIFNDDVQGTGAVVMAALYAAVEETGTPVSEQRMVVFGAGTAGVGIADQLCDSMVDAGADRQEAASHIWLVDRQGLLFADTEGLRDFQKPYLRPTSERPAGQKPPGLLETIRAAQPTLLLGTSTQNGAFTRQVVEAMTKASERPIILPISNPTDHVEADPRDIIAWSGGKALVATGIPVEPFEYGGNTYTIGQANNFLVFPGIGLGMAVSGATRVTPGILAAASRGVASAASSAGRGTSLLPDMENLRAVSATVARAVYDQAVAEGLATRSYDHVVQAIQDAMWTPSY